MALDSDIDNGRELLFVISFKLVASLLEIPEDKIEKIMILNQFKFI